MSHTVRTYSTAPLYPSNILHRRHRSSPDTVGPILVVFLDISDLEF
jgi:hypothetical protein